MHRRQSNVRSHLISDSLKTNMHISSKTGLVRRMIKNYMAMRLVSLVSRGFYSLDASPKITRKEKEPGTQDNLGVCV